MNLVFDHAGCNAISKQENGEGARDLLSFLRSNGAGFIPISGSPSTKPSPERKINSLGSISSLLGVEHPDLAIGLGDVHGGRTVGSMDLTFISGAAPYATFSQDCDPQDTSTWDQVANGLHKFGLRMYPSLQPDYCWLDELSDKMWVNVRECEFKFIYWCNIFGPRYAEHLGRDFLLGAPGWEVRELADGGILYMCVQSFLEWNTNPAAADDAITYFRQKHPRLKQYRAKPGRLPKEVSRILKTDASGQETVVYERDSDEKQQ